MSVHGFEAVSNPYKDIGFFHAGAGVVNSWRVDDHDAFSTYFGLYDIDIASAGLKASADLLLV